MLKTYKHGPVTLFFMGRAPLGFLLYPVYSFLVGDMLIDTGTNRAQKQFLAALKGMQIAKIVNTHHHEDHTGNNRSAQDLFGIPIYAHQSTLPFLDDPGLIDLRLYQRIVWDWPAPSKGTPIGSVIESGEYRFEVIPSPGHCEDHICLYERRKQWLFSGDLYCGASFAYLRRDENFLMILNTLKNLSMLEINTLFCSLKGAVNNGRDALIRKINNMELLRDKVMGLHGRGLPPERIRREVLGKEDSWALITGGHYSKQNTIDSILTGKRPDKIQ
jgi:hypothetical protein